MAKREPDELARDAAAALACKMSYGKWKAMQGAKPQKSETGLPEGWKRCEWCNTPFKPKKNQRFCDVFCQRYAQRDREAQKREAVT